MTELIFEPASEVARRIRNREISAVEVTERHLARIDVVNSAINAVVTRCDDLALERAKEADAALRGGGTIGPLHGVPITMKDAFDTAGIRSTGATKGRVSHVPATNATVVQRLLDAGAILIGKTNTSELTLFYDTDNLLFGKTLNPYDLSRSPGGSSGGSAAIVAAGGSALDVGSDTGGSIRLPAHFCGVAGLKPTAGRVPRNGLIVPGSVPVAPLTQVGPIARYVEDLALVLPIISGMEGRDPDDVPVDLVEPGAVNIEGLKVAYYTDNGEVAATPEVAAVVERCARVLSRHGAEISEDRPEGLEQARPLFKRFFNTDGGAWARRLLETLGTKTVSPYLQWVFNDDDTPEVTAAAVRSLLVDWDRYKRNMHTFMQHYDVILAPVHASVALPHGKLTSAENSPGFSFSQAFNLTGWPSVVVRAGTSARGLPIGIQVVARPWKESVALSAARRIEEALGGWQRPFLSHRSGTRRQSAAVPVSWRRQVAGGRSMTRLNARVKVASES